jgi:hypothetical protein
MIRKEDSMNAWTDDELDMLDELGLDDLEIGLVDLICVEDTDCEVEWSTDGSEDLFDTHEMVAFIEG